MMAFRADEAVASGFEKFRTYLIPRSLSAAEQRRSEEALISIVAKCGPVVDAYPTWHPLVSNHDGHHPQTYPGNNTGYNNLDHTRCMAHGFITCPYHESNAEKVIESINRLPSHPAASITAEFLDVTLYAEGAIPILVRCEWHNDIDKDHFVPKRLAVPLMMEQELPCWRWSERAETWETMRPYLLGQPHGNRSSLFVNQDTALTIKKIYTAMTETGMFGALKDR